MIGHEYMYDQVHDRLLTKISSSRSMFKDVSLDMFDRTVRGLLGSEHITEKEYQLLWLLIRAQGQCVSRDEMVYFLYGDSDEDIPLSNTIEVYITRIRRKVNRISPVTEICAARGHGYYLDVSV